MQEGKTTFLHPEQRTSDQKSKSSELLMRNYCRNTSNMLRRKGLYLSGLIALSIFILPLSAKPKDTNGDPIDTAGLSLTKKNW
jgi:hypothetical protein